MDTSTPPPNNPAQEVSANVEKTDEKIKTEPKKDAPTVVKESPVKDN
jgi:hypothetical protein